MPPMRRRELLQRSASALLAASVAQSGRLAHADTSASHSGIELNRMQVLRSDDGVLLSYDVRITLPADLEQALGKGVAVVFVAQAELFRTRWYWMDEPRGSATRRWRLAFQPLTRQWRVNFDGLSRHYTRLSDALDALRVATRWRVADALAPNDAQDHYVDFSFKLDTDELPRPLQIGLGGNTDWKMATERRIGVPLPR